MKRYTVPEIRLDEKAGWIRLGTQFVTEADAEADAEERVRGCRNTLELACSVYVRWCDHGEPAMSGGQCAYQLVSMIRQALADLPTPTPD